MEIEKCIEVETKIYDDNGWSVRSQDLAMEVLFAFINREVMS